MKVDDWKNLERHPLSAEYKNLSQRERTDIGKSMQEFGFLPERAIVLGPDKDDDGKLKILDGWQRYTVAVEADIEPVFRHAPAEIPQHVYVEMVNDRRRHEDQDVIKARIKARRERVAAALREGKSQGAIAQEEGVAQGTVSADAAKLAAGGVDVTPAGGKIVGADGREQTPKEKGWCARCTRMGVQASGCKGCKKKRVKKAAKKKAAKPAPKSNGQLPFDLRPFNDGIGLVARQWDALGKHYKMKDSAAIESGHDDTKTLKSTFLETLAEFKAQKLSADKAEKEAAKAAKA